MTGHPASWLPSLCTQPVALATDTDDTPRKDQPMSTPTLISQRFAQRLSFHASAAPGQTYLWEAAPAHAVPATTGNAVGNDMARLGGLGENVCVSKKQFTKRITTGRLDRVLT